MGADCDRLANLCKAPALRQAKHVSGISLPPVRLMQMDLPCPVSRRLLFHVEQMGFGSTWNIVESPPWEKSSPSPIRKAGRKDHNRYQSVRIVSRSRHAHPSHRSWILSPMPRSGMGIRKGTYSRSTYHVLVHREPLASILQPTELESMLVAPGQSRTGRRHR